MSLDTLSTNCSRVVPLIFVNPRSLWEKLGQLSKWASGLKIRTFGRERPAELYEFLPQTPGIYIQPGVINVTPAHNLQTEDVRHQWVLLEYAAADQHFAAHLTTLYSLLATHLRECRLTIPNLVAYYAQLFDQPTQTIIA